MPDGARPCGIWRLAGKGTLGSVLHERERDRKPLRRLFGGRAEATACAGSWRQGHRRGGVAVLMAPTDSGALSAGRAGAPACRCTTQ